MKLASPLTNFKVIQPFGANPQYYAKFLDAHGNPEKGHMGIDLEASHGTPVYAAHDGLAFYVGPDAHGGDGVYIRFQDEDAPGTYWTVINWHLIAKGDPLGPTVDNVGRQVKKGDLIGYADNTGAPWESNGDHLHFGLALCTDYGFFLEGGNGYGGCRDPQPYLEVAPQQPDPYADIKAEVQVANQTTDPVVKQTIIALIIKQIRAILGW